MWVKALDKYRQFCERHSADLPFYYQAWWLDAAAGPDAWLPFISEDASHIWPVFVKKAGPFAYAATPPLTPRLGFWPATLPAQAPALPYAFIQPSVQNLSIRSYYALPPAPESVHWQATHTLARREIRAAQNKLILHSSANTDLLFSLVQKSMQRHQLTIRWSADWLQKVFSAAQHQSQVLCAIDPQQRTHAAIGLVWDRRCVYYLAGGMDHHLPQTGASRWLLWNGMRFAAEKGLHFDFGGGMQPSVGNVYASLGGERHTYVRPLAYRYDWVAIGMRWIKNRYAPQDRLFH